MKELARVYDTPWPKGPVRVETVFAISSRSAFTSLDPTVVTVATSSMRNAGLAAAETLFHEASHALVQKVLNEIVRVEKSQKKTLRDRDLWHAIVFYTTGRVVRAQLSELEPYADRYGLWTNDWPGLLPVIERGWGPWLDGKSSLRTAIQQVVAEAPSR